MKSSVRSSNCFYYLRWLTLSIGLLLSTTGLAQPDSTKTFRPYLLIGGQYGISWNQARFSPDIDQTTFTGSRFSLLARYVEAPNLGIQVELSYDQRGWAEQRDTFATSAYEQQIDYLELSLFSHFTITRGAVRPIIFMGTFFGLPIADSREIPTDWTVAFPTYYTEPLERRLQYGLAAGLGFQVDFGPILLQFGGRYRYALSNFFNTGEGSSFTFSQGNGFLADGSLFIKF